MTKERNITNNPTNKPFCCKVGCNNDAIVNIIYGSGIEDNTQSCAIHIAELSGVDSFSTSEIEQSENERPKAESKTTEYKLLAGEACFETLRKVNDAFPDSTDMEWISVKTGLPEKTGWYLTFSEHGGIQTELYEFKESRFLSGEYITHWMPLPKPPKQF